MNRLLILLADIPSPPEQIITQPQPWSIIGAALFVSIWIAGFGLLAARRQGNWLPGAIGLVASAVVVVTAIFIAYALQL